MKNINLKKKAKKIQDILQEEDHLWILLIESIVKNTPNQLIMILLLIGLKLILKILKNYMKLKEILILIKLIIQKILN